MQRVRTHLRGDHRLQLSRELPEEKTDAPLVLSCEKGGMRVVVGRDTPHPMTDQHHIEWIEVINGPYVNRRYLKPGEEPRADFHVPLQKGMVIREFCNIHGLWEYTVE